MSPPACRGADDCVFYAVLSAFECSRALISRAPLNVRDRPASEKRLGTARRSTAPLGGEMVEHQADLLREIQESR